MLFGVYSINLLIGAKNFTGLASYSEIGYECMGRASIYIINFVILMINGLTPIVYFMIFGDIVKSFMIEISGVDDGDFLGSRAFPVIILGVLLFFLIIKREIAELKLASLILFSGVCAFIVIMGLKLAIQGSPENPDADKSIYWKPTFDMKFL